MDKESPKKKEKKKKHNKINTNLIPHRNKLICYLGWYQGPRFACLVPFVIPEDEETK